MQNVIKASIVVNCKLCNTMLYIVRCQICVCSYTNDDYSRASASGTDAKRRNKSIYIISHKLSTWIIMGMGSRFKIQIHLFIKITRFQHGLIHWHWLWTIFEFYPCLLLITVDMEILIKAWSRCHKDQHKWKRSDSPCYTACITVFRTRFKYMWPRAVKKVGRVIYLAF